MDFSTIKNQMEAKDGTGYKHVREICSDVRLVFKNAMKYNDEKSDVHRMAKTLLEKFEEKWLQFLPKVTEEVIISEICFSHMVSYNVRYMSILSHMHPSMTASDYQFYKFHFAVILLLSPLQVLGAPTNLHLKIAVHFSSIFQKQLIHLMYLRLIITSVS